MQESYHVKFNLKKWRSSALPPWRQKYIHKFFLELFCVEELSLLIYLFTHLYHYRLMNIFYSWVIIQLYFICFAQIAPAWDTDSSFISLLCPLKYPHNAIIAGFCFLVLLKLLALYDAPESSSNFPAPVLESTISPRNPGSFNWSLY